MDRCYRLYPKLGGEYLSGPKRWTFPSGAIIDLGHMQHEDSKYNYLGSEYHRIAFDELTQFTETQYLFMFSRLRTTDPGILPQILSTTNPGGVGHQFVRERFINIIPPLRTFTDPKTGLDRIFVPLKIEDNPSLLLADPDYLNRLEALPELEMKRLKYGIWDAFEGQAFTELSRAVHMCEPFDITSEWPRFCVLDWGYAKPFSVGWYAIDYDDVIYRYREWYGSTKETHGKDDGADTGIRMQAWEVAKGILEREQGAKIKMRIADPSIWGKHPEFRRKEARGPTIEEDFVNEGVYFVKADNDRIPGRQQVHKRLRRVEQLDEETGEVLMETPLFQAFSDQPAFWRTMLNVYEDKKNPEDIDSRQEDHCFDEFRYMCMARPVQPKSATEVKQGISADIAKHKRKLRISRRLNISVADAYRHRG